LGHICSGKKGKKRGGNVIKCSFVGGKHGSGGVNATKRRQLLEWSIWGWERKKLQPRILWGGGARMGDCRQIGWTNRKKKNGVKYKQRGGKGQRGVGKAAIG